MYLNSGRPQKELPWTPPPPTKGTIVGKKRRHVQERFSIPQGSVKWMVGRRVQGPVGRHRCTPLLHARTADRLPAALELLEAVQVPAYRACLVFREGTGNVQATMFLTRAAHEAGGGWREGARAAAAAVTGGCRVGAVWRLQNGWTTMGGGQKRLRRNWASSPKRGAGGAGTCFNFHSGKGGGGGSPLDPSPPPLDPLPPSPLSSSAPENLGFGNIF